MTGPLNSFTPKTFPIMGGVYNATPPAPQDGQGCAFQLDAMGQLRVTGGGGGGGGTVTQGPQGTIGQSWFVEVTDGTNVIGTFTHPFRIDPTGTTTQPVEINDGTNVMGLMTDFGTSPGAVFALNTNSSLFAGTTALSSTGSSLNVNITGGASSGAQFAMGSAQSSSSLGTIALGYDGTHVRGLLTSTTGQLHVIVDSGGSGGVQYTDETAESAGAFTITVAGMYNGTDVVGLRSDASNNLFVNLNTPIPAGTNVIGHVITDSGSTTAVTGTVAVTQSTSPWVVSLASTTITGTVAVTQSTSPWTIQGDSASGVSKAGNPVQIGGVFNTTQPTVTNGQTVEAQSTARGGLIVATGVDPFAVTLASTTITGTVAVTQSTSPWVDNITQWNSVSLGSPTAFGVAPSGNVIGANTALFANVSGTQTALTATGTSLNVNITGGGSGGTQYTDGTAESVGAFTITVAGMYNGTDVVGLRSDASNNLFVNLNTAIPAGSNLIGQVQAEVFKATVIETTTPLGASGTFTSAWHDTTVDGTINVTVSILADQDSDGSLGLRIQESDDISNASFINTTIQQVYSPSFNVARFCCVIKHRYWRILYQNGGTPQGVFEITSTRTDFPITQIDNVNNSGATATTFYNTQNTITTPTGAIGNLAGLEHGNQVIANSAWNGSSASFGYNNTVIFISGGNFSGTPDATRESAIVPRTSTVFKTIQATSSGNTAIWTPGSGNKFRVLAFRIDATSNIAQSVQGVVTVSFQDGTSAMPLAIDVNVPDNSVTTGYGAWTSGWIDLGGFGILSATANNVLNVNLSATLTAGNFRVLVSGTEE